MNGADGGGDDDVLDYSASTGTLVIFGNGSGVVPVVEVSASPITSSSADEQVVVTIR